MTLSLYHQRVPNIDDVKKHVKNTETIVYGRCDLMILKDFYDKDNGLSLRNNMGDSFPIINGDYTTILHHEKYRENGSR